MKPPTTENLTSSQHCFIKPSQSLTSLPPPNGDLIQAKLRFERPYNSLKKKRDCERDIFRRSWESAHSHSSCSLQSSTTNNGSGTGKDDFWAALQTNYNYIMDTNLLDSCREAKCELEGNIIPDTKINDSSREKSISPSSKSQGHYGDPRTLRRWLREMENRIEKSPSLSEAMKLKSGEIQKRLTEHSEVYREIVSQARTVAACIRNSEETVYNNKSLSEEKDNITKENCKTANSSPTRKSDSSFKGLERRYHLLYLKAIEIQCLLEGLLARKNSPSPVLRSSDTDDEPAAKLARLNDLEFDSNKGYKDSERHSCTEEFPDDNIRSDDDDWTQQYLGENRLAKKQINGGSDADSEDSDCDIVPILHTNGSVLSSSPLQPITPPLCKQNMETDHFSNNNIENGNEVVEKTLLNSSSITNTSSASLSYSPKIIDTVVRRPSKQVDISKFNRSNRKSKNCAIFYFKHLDTDTEQREGEEEGEGDEENVEGGGSGDNYKSSQDSEEGVFNSENLSSDDEWFYTDENKLKPKSLDFFSIDNNNKELNLNRGKSSNENIDDIVEESIDIVDSIMVGKRTIESINLPNYCNSNTMSLIDVKEEEEVMIEGGEITNIKITMETVSSGKSNKSHYSKESIKQLVLGAETLVREEVILKSQTPKKLNKTFSELFVLSTNNNNNNTNNNNKSTCKSDKMIANPKIKRVQEWLEHQPLNSDNLTSGPTTDCDASGEYTTESDSAAPDSDTSEGMADSIGTCLQGGGSNSQATSSEVIGGSAEPLLETSKSNNGINGIPRMDSINVIMRNNRRNSDRPWSVSCLSQLTQTGDVSRSDDIVKNQGLANFSISESALHTLSSPKNSSSTNQPTSIRNSDSKNSLKKRRSKLRKRSAYSLRKSESGSDGTPKHELPKSLTKSLVKSESFSGQTNLAQDLSSALSQLTIPKIDVKDMNDSEEENLLMKPNFCLGAYTNVTVPGGVSNLGSLAALATYNHDEQLELLDIDQNQTGTEDHSSFSEQAWDNYQEKYQSEPYSEGFDSDAARRLLEFGDDYRNYIDSQSDCCSSSLSAANNLDSLSPPRHRKFGNSIIEDSKRSPSGDGINHSGSGHNSLDNNSLRRRRALELAELEKKRRNSNASKKLSSDERRRSCESTSSNHNRLSPNGTNRLTVSSKSGDSSDYHHHHSTRRLDFDPNQTPSNSATKSRRKASESDNSFSYRSHRAHRINDLDEATRRRSIRSIEKLPIKSTFSSSSSSDSEDDIEVRNFLTQSKTRLEHTEALRIRRHLLRPEDYAEIIATCRDNVRCLESVLRGAPGTVLTTARCQETRELLSSWESLLSWSENASVARQLQEEMTILKSVLNRLGAEELNQFDTEDSILFTVEELKRQKLQLQTHRSTMLRLNASVHSWLTRQEMKINKILENADNDVDKNEVGNEKGEQFDKNFVDIELHKYLKDEVGEMYSTWDEADLRITNRLETLTTSLQAWKQFENGLSEFQLSLGKDKGALCGLKGEIEKGKRSSIDLAHDVKEVARLISEKNIENNIQTQLQNENPQHLHPNSGLLPFNIKSSSNGSLSDSGISDGGCVSDGGLSERERRLGALRRLARQLETALAPGSDALKSISQRMEAAEAELRDLQHTCRELIVRTVTTKSELNNKNENRLHGKLNGNVTKTNVQKSPSPKNSTISNGKTKSKRSPQSKRNSGNISSGSNGSPTSSPRKRTLNLLPKSKYQQNDFIKTITNSDPEDPDDEDPLGCGLGLGKADKSGNWLRRAARLALPVQIAIVTLFCAACLLEPHCCDSINNFSMSFTPHLRYIRGPPPI